MGTLTQDNYQHQHISYDHTIYSKDQETPKQFYHTHTELLVETNTLYHHHHIYHVEYISDINKIIPNTCPPVDACEHPFRKLEEDEFSKGTIEKDESNGVNRQIREPSLEEIDLYDIESAKSILKLRNSLDKQSFLYYYNDYDLRKKIKEAHNHFSLVDLNNYMVKEWSKMSKIERDPWSERALHKMFVPRSRETEIVIHTPEKPVNPRKTNVKIEEVYAPKSPSVIEINISKDMTYTTDTLIGSSVCLDGKKGRVLGTYKRKGKSTRFRVDWGDSKELFYKKQIISMLDN